METAFAAFSQNVERSEVLDNRVVLHCALKLCCCYLSAYVPVSFGTISMASIACTCPHNRVILILLLRFRRCFSLHLDVCTDYTKENGEGRIEGKVKYEVQ